MCSHSVVSYALQPFILWPVKLLCPWDSPGKNTGKGCHALLQGIFPTQELNLCFLCLLHCWQILHPLSHREKPADGLYNLKMLSDHHHRGSKSVLEKKINSRGTSSAVRGRTGVFEDSDALGTIEGKLGSTAVLPPTSCDDPHKDMPLGIHWFTWEIN